MLKNILISCCALLIFSLAIGKDKEIKKVDFKKDIWPIVKRSCIKCHREPYKKNGKLKKPKGELVLTTKKGFLKGSEEGKIIIPGKPLKSSFYKLTILPEDDDDIMPAKGDPLSKEETALFKKWILEGAKFNKWVKEEKKSK
ncbi:MAG: hypothetical protein COA79_01950 [Planctomycetota bacterium]|nr:MAG: hypothetical protein COA79_01950 [Planctomycetota bacterium]